MVGQVLSLFLHSRLFISVISVSLCMWFLFLHGYQVIEILSHVNKRVKHQPIIGLPLSDLWKLYLESSSAPMVRNFCIVYIEMAIDRVQKEVGLCCWVFDFLKQSYRTFTWPNHETAGKTINSACIFNQHFEAAFPTPRHIT